MSDFKQKSKTNGETAYFLFEQNMLDASANRFYYSAFQKLYNYASKKGYEYKSEGKSHLNLQDFLEDNINCLMQESDFKVRIKATQASQATGSFDILKRYRKKADYSTDNITPKDMVKIIENKKIFDKSMNLLNEIG